MIKRIIRFNKIPAVRLTIILCIVVVIEGYNSLADIINVSFVYDKCIFGFA